MDRSLVTLAFGNFAVGVTALVVTGILVPISLSLEVATSTTGTLVTAYAFAYAVSAPLVVLFAGALSRRTLLMSGLGLLVAGNLLGALAPTFEILLISRVLAALGAASFTPNATAVAAALAEPAKRGKAIGVVFGGFTVATALGVPFGTFLGLTFGWRFALGAVAFLAAVAALALFPSLPRDLRLPRVSPAVFRATLTSLPLVLALSVTIIQMTSQFVVGTFIAPLLIHAQSLDANAVTLVFLAFGISSVVGNVAASYAGDAWGPGRTVTASLALLIATFIALPLLYDSLAFGVVLVCIWGAVGFGFHAPQQARLVALAPNLGQATLALNASGMYLGTSAGSAIGAVVIATGGQAIGGDGYSLLAPVAAAIAVLALGVFLASRVSERRAAGAQVEAGG